jgi:hypothetical protein
VSKPGWRQGGPPDAGKPQIYDQAPPQWTGVPVERDPVSGRLLSGDPLGRGDKGRSVRSPGKTALITAAAVVVVAAVAMTVFLVTRGDEGDDPAAAAGVRGPGETTLSTPSTTSAAPTTTTPPVETGPRDIPIAMTFTQITPPPGFGPDPAYGTVGQVITRTWTVTGPCDGTGPCDVQHCQEPGSCSATFTGTPQGSGYVSRFTTPVQWGAPECTGGTIDNTITWAFSGEGDALVVTGSWVEQASQVLFTGSDGRDCGLYLAELTIASQ